MFKKGDMAIRVERRQKTKRAAEDPLYEYLIEKICIEKVGRVYTTIQGSRCRYMRRDMGLDPFYLEEEHQDAGHESWLFASVKDARVFVDGQTAVCHILRENRLSNVAKCRPAHMNAMYALSDNKPGMAIFGLLAWELPDMPPAGKCPDFWTADGEILSRSKQAVDALADMFDGLGFPVKTGWHDPAEDAGNGETSIRTGFYYLHPQANAGTAHRV